METSDSEYFESADEDFQSDEEDTKTVKSSTSSDVKDVNKGLEKVKLEENKVVGGVDDNKNAENARIDNLEKDKENNLRRKEAKEETEKLRVEDSKKGGGDKKKAKVIEESLKSEEEDLWGESDWGKDEEPKVESKKIETSKKEEEKGEKRKLETKSEETVSKESSEDLWGESELDWGKENEKEENMWDNDDWEPLEEPPQKTEEKASAWGSWGNWGVSTILSTATQSVSTLTQGISNVLETGIGVPDPEELARINHSEKEKLKEVSDDDSNVGFGLGNLVMGVSHLTKLVETTGTKVISGGLDTLETIGKKTMEVLQEGDPGLKKKRAFLKIETDKPVLSQLLREAKEKAELENKILEKKHFKTKNYETLFDDHQGLVHLEALEMLSKQCDIKLQTLLESHDGESLQDMQETMDQVKELCELPDEDEDEHPSFEEIVEKLNSAVSEINVPISYKKLIETWNETETWLNNLKLEICDERELHQQAVETLAQLTALAVEQFHKTGELLLVKEHRSTADEADSLVQLTSSLTSLIGVAAAKFSDKLNAKSSSCSNKEEVNSLITNVFFEAANSSSYIQDAFQLLIPVLQVGAV